MARRLACGMLTLGCALGCGASDADGGRGRGGGTGATAGGDGDGVGSGGQVVDMGAVLLAEDLRGQECASSTAGNTLQPADVIWAVDNGGNIQSDIEFIRDNMNALSERIVDSGIDMHLVLITDALDPDVMTMATPLGGPAGDWRALCIDAPLGSGSCPDDSKLPTFRHVDYEVGTGSGLVPLVGNHPLNVFISQYDSYRESMRPAATKTFVAVTDVDATDPENNSVDAFMRNAGALDGDMFADFKVSAVVAVDAASCPASFFPPQRGQVYIDLAGATGGVVGDLCKMEFGPVFDDIARGIIGASELQCEWEIPPPPSGMSFNPYEVNVIITSAGSEQAVGQVASAQACAGVAHAWYYDDPDAPARLLACPQTCELIRNVEDGHIDVLFGCGTLPAGPQ